MFRFSREEYVVSHSKESKRLFGVAFLLLDVCNRQLAERFCSTFCIPLINTLWRGQALHPIFGHWSEISRFLCLFSLWHWSSNQYLFHRLHGHVFNIIMKMTWWMCSFFSIFYCQNFFLKKFHLYYFYN